MPCSSYSLGFTQSKLGKFAPSVNIQISVMERYLELLKQHDFIKEGKAPPVPLLAQPPVDTRAILICRILVPQGEKKDCMESKIYTTNVASRVYPHLLVHVGPSNVVVAQQPVTPPRSIIEEVLFVTFMHGCGIILLFCCASLIYVIIKIYVLVTMGY